MPIRVGVVVDPQAELIDKGCCRWLMVAVQAVTPLQRQFADWTFRPVHKTQSSSTMLFATLLIEIELYCSYCAWYGLMLQNFRQTRQFRVPTLWYQATYSHC